MSEERDRNKFPIGIDANGNFVMADDLDNMDARDRERITTHGTMEVDVRGGEHVSDQMFVVTASGSTLVDMPTRRTLQITNNDVGQPIRTDDGTWRLITDYDADGELIEQRRHLIGRDIRETIVHGMARVEESNDIPTMVLVSSHVYNQIRQLELFRRDDDLPSRIYGCDIGIDTWLNDRTIVVEGATHRCVAIITRYQNHSA